MSWQGGDSWVVVMRDAARFDGSYVVQLLHTELSCYSECREEVLRCEWAVRWTGTQTWHSFYTRQQCEMTSDERETAWPSMDQS